MKRLHKVSKFRTMRVLNLKQDADVAQLVEQLTCNQPVGGSTPLISSTSSLESLYIDLILILTI